MSGMLVAAYHPDFDKLPQVRIVILSLGSLFLFALTVEVVKKRYHMNVISMLLKDLQINLGLKKEFRFPLGISEDISKYLKERPIEKKGLADNKDPVFKFFKISYARQYLTYVILIGAISMASLAEWQFIEFIRLGKYDSSYYLIGIVVVIGGVAASLYNYLNEKMRSKLEVSAEVTKTALTPRDEQTVKITVKDAKSKKFVVGAKIECYFKLAKLVESDKNDGQLSHTWTIDNSLGVGIYEVVVGVSAKRYQYASTTAEFKVEK